uniref:Uncharacterized protein n=1 Tax=Heliothis virescens TaxID=7102 RepID=A0A2A4JBQ1_HELVI
MDNNSLKESSSPRVSSLEGMYTDFDEWVVKFTAYYKRSPTSSSQEISTTKPQNPIFLQSDILENDSLFRDLLLRHWNDRHTAKPPSCLENDGLVSYDQLFYRFVNKNCDRQIICQIFRSKL